MRDDTVAAWDGSYSRRENFIFYPHDELVKFLNRHVRKRLGPAEYRDLLGEGPLKALDFGCGIGAGVQLLHEFGIDGFGVDISPVAIRHAKDYAAFKGLRLDDRLQMIAPGDALPFDDNAFDFFISYGVLDSMPFDAARSRIRELARVTTTCGYLSLIAGDYRGFYGDEAVTTTHERDTIQSYFSPAKCEALFEGSGFAIRSFELVARERLDRGEHPAKSGRYHLVVEKPGDAVSDAAGRSR